MDLQYIHKLVLGFGVSLLGGLAQGATLSGGSALDSVSVSDRLLGQRLYLRYLTLEDDTQSTSSERFHHLWMSSLSDPYQPSVQYYIARVQSSMGLSAEAINTMQKAFDLSSKHDKEIGETLADMAYRANLLSLSGDVLKSLIEAYPDDKSLHIRLVEVYRKKGDLTAAISTLDKLIEMGEGLSILTLEKAKILVTMGRMDEALKILEAQVQASPSDLETLSYLVSIYLSSGHIAKARAAIAEGRKYVTGPSVLDELTVYASIADSDYIRAAKEIQRVARTEDALPGDIEKLMAQSVSISQDKVAMTRALIPVQEELVELYEQSGGLKLQLADNYFVIGDSLKGESVLTRMIDAKSEETYPYTYFIEKYIQSRDVPKVLGLTTKAISLFPHKGTFYVYALMSYGEINDKERAYALTNEAMKAVPQTDPDYGDLVLIKADQEADRGDYTSARKYYELAIQYAKTPLALNNYAYFLATHGTPEDLIKAEDLASRAVQRVRNFPTFLDTYAWVLYLRGEYALAKIYIDSAISNEEEPNSVYYEHQGDILSKMAKTQEAINAYEKAIKAGGNKGELTEKINKLKSHDE